MHSIKSHTRALARRNIFSGICCRSRYYAIISILPLTSTTPLHYPLHPLQLNHYTTHYTHVNYTTTLPTTLTSTTPLHYPLHPLQLHHNCTTHFTHFNYTTTLPTTPTSTTPLHYTHFNYTTTLHTRVLLTFTHCGLYVFSVFVESINHHRSYLLA